MVRVAPVLIAFTAACSSGGGAVPEPKPAPDDAAVIEDADVALDDAGAGHDAGVVTDPAARLREGRKLAQGQKWSKAIAELELASSAGSVDALAELAFTATLAGDDRRAAKAAQAVLDLPGADPAKRATAYYHLGRAAELRGDVTAARDAYQASIDLRASDAVSDRLAALGAKRRALPAPPAPPCSKPQPKAALCGCLGEALQIEQPNCSVDSHRQKGVSAYAITVVSREQAPTFLVHEAKGQAQVLARIGLPTPTAPDAELTITRWTAEPTGDGHAIRVDAQMSTRGPGGKLTTLRRDAIVCLTTAPARCVATVPLTEKVGTPSQVRLASLSLEVTDTSGVAHVTLVSGPANPATYLGTHQLW